MLFYFILLYCIYIHTNIISTSMYKYCIHHCTSMQVFGYHSRIRKINPVCPHAAPVSTVSTTRFNKDQLVGVFHVEKNGFPPRGVPSRENHDGA